MKTNTGFAQLNLEIPEDVKRGLKSGAALSGRTLKDFAGEVLREAAAPYQINSTGAEPPKRPAIPSDASEMKVQELGRIPEAVLPSVDKPAHAAQTQKPSASVRKAKGRRA